jgi:hypothetical protein
LEAKEWEGFLMALSMTVGCIVAFNLSDRSELFEGLGSTKVGNWSDLGRLIDVIVCNWKRISRSVYWWVWKSNLPSFSFGTFSLCFNTGLTLSKWSWIRLGLGQRTVKSRGRSDCWPIRCRRLFEEDNGKRKTYPGR